MADQKNHAQAVNMVKQHVDYFTRVAETLDAEKFGEMLHDDWVMIDARGQRFTKEEELELLRGSELSIDSIKVSDVEVQLFGDVAVVTGFTRTKKAKFQGENIGGRYRFTQVWRHKDRQDLTELAGARTSTSGGLENFAMMTCVNFQA